jgi:hypothetical protein
MRVYQEDGTILPGFEGEAEQAAERQHTQEVDMEVKNIGTQSKKMMTEEQFQVFAKELGSKMRKRLLMSRVGDPWLDIESMLSAAMAGTWVGAMGYTADFVQWYLKNNEGKGLEIPYAIRAQSEKVLTPETKERLGQAEKKVQEQVAPDHHVI